MLTTALANSPFFAPTYDRNGGLSSLRTEPARRITGTPEKGSTMPAVPLDRVTLSANGIEKSQVAISFQANSTPSADAEPTEPRQSRQQPGNPGVQAFSPAEEQMMRELKARDPEVKTHEQAHLAAAGRYARGAPSYSYQQGPDGRRYAVGGEVGIDTGKEKTPEETIEKMQTVRRAAMAPASPSSADRAIAAAAAAMEAQARQEMQVEQAKEMAEAPASASEESEPETATVTRSLDTVV